jgi:O-antigen/teichoic acid export membrane protein
VPGAVIYAVADVADRIMVGWFAGPAEVAIVALALSIRGVVLVFSKWFGIVWEPTVVEWLATKNPEFYLPRLQVMLNALSVAFFGMACLVAIWIVWLIRAIYPSSYLPTAQLIPFLAISAGCATLSRVAVTTITLAGAPGRYFRNNAFALTLEIAVGILTIPVIGALGAALCTLVQEMALLLGWRYIGKVRLKNLPLDWRFALCVMIGAVTFVGAHTMFYAPGPSLLEPILLTVPIAALAAVYLLRQRGVLGERHRSHSSA